MLITSIKRYLERKRRWAERPPAKATRGRPRPQAPEVLWRRGLNPQDLGSLKQELGSD